jgi:hypothetical protein
MYKQPFSSANRHFEPSRVGWVPPTKAFLPTYGRSQVGWALPTKSLLPTHGPSHFPRDIHTVCGASRPCSPARFFCSLKRSGVRKRAPGSPERASRAQRAQQSLRRSDAGPSPRSPCSPGSQARIAFPAHRRLFPPRACSALGSRGGNVNGLQNLRHAAS